ncbi:response regulator [Herbaspirillum lusitanum]|uniref:Response regulator n=1 Tax=Herbaspirillum lusitanum TaxID=213312 RepID=A0ABW9A2W4_9BURK
MTETTQAVLVVEDDDDTRYMLAHVLRESGRKVIEAVDGVDALEQMKLHELSIVLTDLRMPRMNGIELARKLKKSASYKNIPIVLISATPPSPGQRIPEFAAVLVKPFAIAGLLRCVDELLTPLNG